MRYPAATSTREDAVTASGAGGPKPLLLAHQIPTPYLLNHVLWLEEQAESASNPDAKFAYWNAYQRLVEMMSGVTGHGPIADTGPRQPLRVYEITAQPGPPERDVEIDPVESLRRSRLRIEMPDD
jgi:hypothetical protein